VVAVKKLLISGKIFSTDTLILPVAIFILFFVYKILNSKLKKRPSKINDKLSLDKTTKDTKALMRSLLSFTPLRT
jgi:hypothetical protein